MTDLKPYLNNVTILLETAKQVSKDFSILGIEITFSENSNNTYLELFHQILPHIEKLQKVNFQNFYNLLYRIDLSEDQIKREMAASVDKTFSEVVTDLILKREMLKVVMRKNYSSRSNQ